MESTARLLYYSLQQGNQRDKMRRKSIFEPNRAYCSDITNTLVGISGETVPEGGNLCIY